MSFFVFGVMFDHDAGALSYRVNDSQVLQALPLSDGERWPEGCPRGFPRGAALRPYASCYYPGDCLTFVTVYV